MFLLQSISTLFYEGADIEQGSSTPLMEASQEGHVDLVKFLLSKGQFACSLDVIHTVVFECRKRLLDTQLEGLELPSSQLVNGEIYHL